MITFIHLQIIFTIPFVELMDYKKRPPQLAALPPNGQTINNKSDQKLKSRCFTAGRQTTNPEKDDAAIKPLYFLFLSSDVYVMSDPSHHHLRCV